MTLAGTRVLVVEDEAMVAMLIEDFLVELGCKVAASAARLDAALEQARMQGIDVAVLDVNLAGQLSYPVASVLRTRGIPFVFATGYPPSNLPPEMQSAPVLSKPFTLQQLADALRVMKNSE